MTEIAPVAAVGLRLAIDAERYSPLGAGVRRVVGVGVWRHAVGVGRKAIKPAFVSGPRSGK